MHSMPLVLRRIDSSSRSDRHRKALHPVRCWKRRQPATGEPNNEKVHSMLYTIAVVLIILWLLGLVSAYTLGGFIHVLLVIAIVMILLNVISGRRAL
jgi:hypothetical protein